MTSPVPRDVWESALKSDVTAAVTQSLPWRDALFASGRYKDVSRLYEFGSGQRIVLPLARRRVLPGRTAVTESWPSPWAFAGPISQDGQVTDAEAAAVLADLAASTMLAVRVKLRHDADDAWLAAASQFEVEPIADWVLDLRGGFGDVWERKFGSSVRRAVRKAERSGLDVEVDQSGRLLGVFHDLYQKSVLRWAALQHAPVWLTRMRLAGETAPARMELMAKCFGPDLATWVARSNGEPVAAIVTIRSGAYTKYLWGAMEKEHAGLVRAPDLLHRLAIEEACQKGYRFYDFGGARPESSLGAYKKKFGATLAFRHTLYRERIPIQALKRAPTELIKKMTGFRDNV